MDKTTHTLRDFVEFSKTHPFRIPFYQRGYVWGKKRPNDEEDSVHFLLNSLLKVKDDMPVFYRVLQPQMTALILSMGNSD